MFPKHTLARLGIRTKAQAHTSGRCAVRQMSSMSRLGVHQGSVLSPYLFIMILDEISAGIPGDAPRTMLFADDLVIASSSRIKVENTLEKWRVALENAGLKISRKKTEHLAMNAGPEIVRMDGYQLKKVTSFKYLGSRVNENATTEEDMLRRTQCGWMKWRDLTPMLCDKRMPLNVKSKLYITVVRPAMLYGAGCWATKSVGIKKMEAAEMKMLRWTTGKTKLDKIPNTITMQIKNENGTDRGEDKDTTFTMVRPLGEKGRNTHWKNCGENED